MIILLKYINNEGSVFTFKTNLNALRYKLVNVDVANLNAGFKDLVSETNYVLQYVACVNNDKLLLNYLHDCRVKKQTSIL
jgi:prolyl oligopeptidase